MSLWILLSSTPSHQTRVYQSVFVFLFLSQLIVPHDTDAVLCTAKAAVQSRQSTAIKTRAPIATGTIIPLPSSSQRPICLQRECSHRRDEFMMTDLTFAPLRPPFYHLPLPYRRPSLRSAPLLLPLYLTCSTGPDYDSTPELNKVHTAGE